MGGLDFPLDDLCLSEVDEYAVPIINQLENGKQQLKIYKVGLKLLFYNYYYFFFLPFSLLGTASNLVCYTIGACDTLNGDDDSTTMNKQQKHELITKKSKFIIDGLKKKYEVKKKKNEKGGENNNSHIYTFIRSVKFRKVPQVAFGVIFSFQLLKFSLIIQRPLKLSPIWIIIVMVKKIK